MLYPQGRGHSPINRAVPPVDAQLGQLCLPKPRRLIKSTCAIIAMPYVKRRSYRRAALRKATRPANRYSRTVYRRRSTVRKRIYKKKRYARKVLNVSTRKKQDNMQPVVINVTGPIGTPTPGPFSMDATNGLQICLWNATWRPKLTQLGGAQPTVDDDATRSSTRTYMKGLSERIEIQTSGSAAWEWRRITFTFFSNHFYLFNDNPLENGTAVRYNIETNSGVNRALTFFNGANPLDAQLVTQLFAYVFKGAQDTDWRNPLTAKTHSDRVRIKSDRTRVIRSGNDAGVIKKYKLYHPMEQALIYDEDESGGVVGDGVLSAAVNQSMGDYYVLDIFKPTLAAESTEETLSFAPEATLYWHER